MKPTLKGQRNQCSSCREYFARNSGFTKHRTGSFAADARRCLSVTEMQAQGFTVDVDGFWRLPGPATRPASWSSKTADVVAAA